MSRSKKNRWFTIQAAKLQLAAPGTFPTDSIVCALCSNWFHRDALHLLTIEHVPAEKLGGRPLVVTCEACNNSSGSRVEAETRRLRDLEDGPDKPLPVALELGGHEVQARFALVGGSISIQWDDKHNRPGAVDALNAHLADNYPDGGGQMELGVTLKRPIDQYLADVGWLKAGYLALFAAIGHAVVLSPSFTKVRAEIQDPMERRLKGFYAEMDEDAGNTIWQILDNEHELHGCYVVSFGRHTVILPCPYWWCDPYPYLGTQVGRAVGMTAYMEPLLSWPLEPILEHDGAFDWSPFIAPSER